MTVSSREAGGVSEQSVQAPASASDAVVIDHEFKSHPSVFWPAARGEKLFEYRRDDRGGYEVGQTVRLRCFHPERGYLPFPPVDSRITNILRGGEFELPAGYCILGLAPPAVVPESVRRLSEAIQITDACVLGVYQYPVHGDAEWLVGWLFTKPNLDAGKRKVADLARLALEVRNLLPAASDDEPLTSTDAVRHWEAEQAMAAGEPVTSSDALALWKVERVTPSGRADTPLVSGGAVEALRGIADDYMTSERHHPGYVLIPAAKFERLRAASEALPPAPLGSGGAVGSGDEAFDARVSAALAAWNEAQRAATVDEGQEDTDYGAMMHAVAAADALAAPPAAPEPAAGGGREKLQALVQEVDELPNPERSLLSHNERVLIEFCQRLAEPLRSILSAPAGAQTAGGEGGFQARVQAFMQAVAGDDETDVPERRDRFAEEAMELVQALGADREAMHHLVDYVFGRPIGEPAAEMGGTAVTLAGLAAWTGLDMAACGEAELARCSTPAMIAKIRSKRSTRHGRGALPGFSAPPSSTATAHDASEGGR